MPSIRTNTDWMRQLGQVFVQLNDQIQNEIEPQIESYAGRLESDWQGVSRQRFEQMYEQWHTTISQMIAEGEDIGRYLQNTATLIEQAEQS